MAEAECEASTREPASARGRDWMELRAGEAPSRETNTALQLIAAAFAEDVGRIWAGRRIGEYLSPPDGRRHLWHACLAAEAGIFRPHDRDPAEVSYARFTAWKGKHLIAQAYGICAPGLPGALTRLGPKARRPEVYRALVNVMESGGTGARFLSQSATLSNALILAVAVLPPELRLKRVLRELDGRRGPEEAAFFAWSLGRLAALQGGDAAAAILAAPRPMQALAKARESFPFPAPPWAGDERLRPVTTPRRLMEIAKAFDNCLLHFPDCSIGEVRTGAKYFYEWRGEEPALLEFTACPPLGWRLAEAKGPKNAPLSARSRAAILAALALCPAFAPVWPMEENDLLAGL